MTTNTGASMSRRILTYRLNTATAIHEACREDEMADLSGCGPEEWQEEGEIEPPMIGLEALEAELVLALADVRAMLAHEHSWDERGFCGVCGRDGNA